MLYVHEAYKAQIMADGLVRGGTRSVVSRASETENFHGILTPQPCAPRLDGWWLLLRLRVMDYLRSEVKKFGKGSVKSLWRKLVSWYVRKHEEEISPRRSESPLQALARFVSE
jgi:hypothetical protein